MKIFVSHASEQAELAAAIALSLRGDGHEVFFDRSSLPPGESYDDQIRAAIAESDLLVFLVSPQAVTRGRYTLTELEFAEAKWPHPAGHVLPVIVEPTDLREVPTYLKAVTLLEPRGNVPATIAAAVSRSTRATWRRRVARALVPSLVVTVLLGAASWWAYEFWQDRRAVAALVAAARLQEHSGHFAAAWEQYARVTEKRPRDRSLTTAREELAMSWLRNVKVTAGQETFTDVVERVEDVLVACAASAEPVRAADCLAHLGWADFLRSRDGGASGQPVTRYEQAIERDPGNVYARAMWGFDVLRTGGSLAAARAQFARALSAGRERPWVRRMQLAALLWRRDEQAEGELVRVANDIRLDADAHDDAILAENRWRLWNVYYARVVSGYDTSAFLASVPPADHLATFNAVFPTSAIPSDKQNLYRLMLGTLQEHAGDPAAIATYQDLHAALVREGAFKWGGTLPDRAEAALKRMQQRAPGVREGSKR